MATFTWVIPTTEYDLQPADMDGAIVVAHWRCTAEQTEGTGDDAVTYTTQSSGTCALSPDPSASGYTPFADVTESQVLGWCYEEIDKDAIEQSLAAQIEADKNPTQAAGVPW